MQALLDNPPNPNIPEKFIDRFFDKVQVDPVTGCWHFDAARFRNGYAHFHNPVTTAYAHRFSFLAFNGPLQKGLSVQHRCPAGSNKACVNPAHLFQDTAKKNSQDAVVEGLYSATPRRKQVKATTEEIADIRKRFNDGESLYSIAKKWNRSVPYVSSVASMKLHTGKPRKPRAPLSGISAVEKPAKKKSGKVWDTLATHLAKEAA
ncbi:HNH endonuclease [Granulicella mallensis]|uniref:HNH nuclease domain-containing protein n=1 Tax=Granulicella mallensis (strain ATCC BAA-1857 / DSM 23137 / MP5ACTX8) TaxID=682795 RepID=G8NR83_GRAMM|nr:HNH endonuclease [Granulicella mallensis]AEU36161.1 hypothetical protein AciX8_1824 [Granulicella mallensis MP5ACTX8]